MKKKNNFSPIFRDCVEVRIFNFNTNRAIGNECICPVCGQHYTKMDETQNCCTPACQHKYKRIDKENSYREMRKLRGFNHSTDEGRDESRAMAARRRRYENGIGF